MIVVDSSRHPGGLKATTHEDKAGSLVRYQAGSIMPPQAELGVRVGCRLRKLRVIEGLVSPHIPYSVWY